MNSQKNKGITLIELIIAVAIAGIIIVAITTLMEWGSKGFKNTQDELDVQMETQMLVNLIGDRVLEGNCAKFSENVQAKALTIYNIVDELPKKVKCKKVIWLDRGSHNLYLMEKEEVTPTTAEPVIELIPDKECLMAQSVEDFSAEIKDNKIKITLTLKKAIRSITMEQEVKMRNKYVSWP